MVTDWLAAVQCMYIAEAIRSVLLFSWLWWCLQRLRSFDRDRCFLSVGAHSTLLLIIHIRDRATITHVHALSVDNIYDRIIFVRAMFEQSQ